MQKCKKCRKCSFRPLFCHNYTEGGKSCEKFEWSWWKFIGRSSPSNSFSGAKMSPDWITDWLSRSCVLLLLFATLFLSNTDHRAPLSKIHQSTIYYAGLLGGWDKRIVDQESDVPSIIFLILFIDLGISKLFFFIFVILYRKNWKMNWKGFWKEFCKILWKKNSSWNNRRLVDELFVPSV